MVPRAAGTAWLDAARALAHGVATDGEPEVNPDPIERIRLEELARVAELHVADATGLPVGSGDHPLTFIPVGRGAWALKTLDAWAPLLEKMVAAQDRWPSRRPPTGDDLEPPSAGTWAGWVTCWAGSPSPWARSWWACSSARPPGTWPSGPWAGTRCPSRGRSRASC